MRTTRFLGSISDRAAMDRALQPTKIWIGSLRDGTRSGFVRSWLASEGFGSDVVTDVFVKNLGRGVDGYGFIDVVSREVL